MSVHESVHKFRRQVVTTCLSLSTCIYTKIQYGKQSIANSGYILEVWTSIVAITQHTSDYITQVRGKQTSMLTV
jgi:hypothetical protein